ncbi:hypothetical protein Y032_0847g2668 [Ancylostoma ceylanicum]|uniref:Uncharacterized protein n=1 Tax=Ancylostoma ceylanicum TaxID=53326 RepID=A0A016WB61_9BILA|nr:hypothetical protein Y032_0847g2668 [Ancylostoma ceylanicum]
MHQFSLCCPGERSTISVVLLADATTKEGRLRSITMWATVVRHTLKRRFVVRSTLAAERKADLNASAKKAKLGTVRI